MSDLSRRGFVGSAGLAASLLGLTAGANDDAEEGLATARARLALARAALEVVRANVGRGQFSPGERDPISIWSRRRLEARLDLSKTKADRVAAAQEHVDEMKHIQVKPVDLANRPGRRRPTRMTARIPCRPFPASSETER